MSYNTTISALTMSKLMSSSPFFSNSRLSFNNAFVFSKISVQKSKSSFFSSSSPYFTAKISHSSFNRFLQSSIRVVSEKYSLLDTKTRIVFNRKANIFMNDCSFSGCKATGTGIDGHGGAICIFLGPEDLFSISLERLSFNKCQAKSSGGSIFAFNTKFSAIILCFSESYAAKNTVMYLQSVNEITINCTYCANNKISNEFNPCSNTIGCSSSIIVFNEVNMSKTCTDKGAGYVSAYRFKYFNMNHAVYDKSECDYGLYMHSVGELTALSHACIFKNSTFNEKMLMHVDVSITFYHCFFIIGSQNFVADNEKPYVTISSSYIEGNEEEWKERIKGIKFSDIRYDNGIESMTKFTLTDAQGSCREHEQVSTYFQQLNFNSNEEKLESQFSKLLKVLLPLVVISCGLILVIFVTRKRKFNFKAPSAFSR